MKAAHIAKQEDIARPILLGDEKLILQRIEDLKLDGLSDVQIIDTKLPNALRKEEYTQAGYKKRQRRGWTLEYARSRFSLRNYYGVMMVEMGDADAMISGLTRNYNYAILPAIELIGPAKQDKKVSSMYMMRTRKGHLFFADTTVIPSPTTREIVDIAKLTAATVKKGLNIEPRVAMLSSSNFGTLNDEEAKKMREATAILKEEKPDLVVDGEVYANFALDTEKMKKYFSFSPLAEKTPNILIFPNLSAANISYKLVETLGAKTAIGPIILGLKKPVHVLEMGSSVDSIVNMITIAVVDAQMR